MNTDPSFRIGFDAKRLFTNWTGLGNYSRTLLTNLEDFYPDHEYLLYTPRLPESPIAKQFSKPPFRPVMPKRRSFGGWWRRFGLSRRLLSDRVALYHGLSNELPSGIRRTGIPSVVTIHDLIFRRLPHTYPEIDRQVYDFKFRAACREADRIIAISESTKADIMEYYDIPPEKIDVIYQACDPIFYREPLEEVEALTVLESYQIPDEYFLYVGSVIPRKNLLTLVKALERLPESRRLPLVVVGRGGGYKKEVERYVARKGLQEWISWQTQVLSTHDLKAIYEMATALIYPSVYEGFGIPVVEAQLCRTPVITSFVSSMPEAAGADAWLIDPTREEELAAALEQLLDDPEETARRTETAYRYVADRFAPEPTTRRVMEIYRDLLS